MPALRSSTPQLEDGYTKIADELLEALCRVNLGGREMAVVLALIRKTYGWQKKKDRIAASQLAELTAIPRNKIPSLLRSLEAKNIIRIEKGGQGRIATLSIKKDHRKWLIRGRPTYPTQGASSETNIPPRRGKSPTSPLLTTTYPQEGGRTYPQEGAYNREINKTREMGIHFGRLKPRLTKQKIATLIAIRPGGALYSADQVQAWFLMIEPVILAKGYKSPVRSCVNWFRNVKPDEIRRAVAWVESQAMEELKGQEDTREKDSPEDFAEAFGL